MFAHVGSAPVEEALMVLAPVSILIGALLLANRRASRISAARAEANRSDPLTGESLRADSPDGEGPSGEGPSREGPSGEGHGESRGDTRAMQ